jgi:predicted nucleic acid-binding protein
MKVVLDTNVLLVSIAKKSPYRLIFDSLLTKQFDLIISNDILSEYTEIIAQKANVMVATNISEMLLALSNVQKQDVFYGFQFKPGQNQAPVAQSCIMS